MSKTAAEEQTDAVWGILDEGFKISAQSSGNISTRKSLMDFFEEKVSSSDHSSEVRRNILDHARMWGAMIGTEIERQSFKFFWLEEVIDGESLFMASTYKNIVDLIAEKALTGANLHLSTEVTGIHYKEATRDSESCVEVRLADGTSTVFDEVVVTAPLGWLKLNKEIFTPQLPQRLSNAIDNIGWGNLEKAWVKFPSAWWHTKETPFPGETLFIRPEYAPDTNPKFWNQEIVSLAALPPPFDQPIIMFYLYGENSKKLTGQINGLDPHSKEYYNILDTFFRPYYSRLPNFDETSKECVPVAFECTNWSHDPWTGNGSYSNFQVGLAHGDQDIEAYRAGMGKERGIWFAGEATAPFVALGTVTGAYWSGEVVAGKMLALYGLEQGEVEDEAEDESLPRAAVVTGVEDAELIA